MPSVKHIVLQEHITVGMLKVMSFLLLCDTVALKPGYFDHYGFLVSKETVVLRRWGG